MKMTHTAIANIFLFASFCFKVMGTNTACPDVKCYCGRNTISCPDIGFTQVPTFASENTNVEFLLLDNNLITTIPEKAFSMLPNLQLISLQNNPLQNVHPSAFNGVDNKVSLVNQLKLSSPNLRKEFKFNLTTIVQQLPNLKIFEVSRLFVDKLETNFAHNILTQMMLDDVGLIEIDPQAFQRAVALSSLVITKNSWQKSNTATTLHTWLAPLLNLQELDISSNELNGKLDNLPSLPKLRTLKLDRNSLTSISPEAVKGVKASLQVLRLGYNIQLTNINDMLNTLQYLESLYLSSNREALTNLPTSLVQMPQLRHLNIDYTHLSSLGQNELPSSLETLSMVSCSKLKYIDSLAFANTNNLKTLIIEEFDADDISDVNWKLLLSYTQNLNKLYLSPAGNAKKTLNSSIWESVRTMTHMTDLALINNRLEYVPDFVFQNLHMLQILNLAGNYLTKLTSATFSGLNNLKKLTLNGNRLKEFDNCTFSMMPLSVELVLEDNPLQCVCSMRWLRLFLNNSNHLASLTCENRVDKLSWSQLTPDQFCTADESAKLPICQIKTPPTASTMLPPRYSLQVSALKLFLEKESQPLVRIDINITQDISKILTNWYVTYGEEGRSERRRTTSLSGQTSFVDISDGLQRGKQMVFCPVFVLFSAETYTHQSYCRSVSLKDPIEWKLILIIGITGGGLLMLLVVMIFCYISRHRKVVELQKNLTTTCDNTVVEEEDPYAYAVPDLLMKTGKFKRNSKDFIGVRTQPNSRAFTRAKSHDANLNATHNSISLSSKIPAHHQSTPQLLKGYLPNGHANGAFTTSMLSLHQSNIQKQRLSIGNSTFSNQVDQRRSEFNVQSIIHNNPRTAPPIQQQRRLKAQTLQVNRPNEMARSIGNLAVRALPPAPRLAKSVEIMLDNSGCDEEYEEEEDSVYVPMVQACDKKVDYQSWTDTDGKYSINVDSYGISSAIRYVPQPRSKSNSFSRPSNANTSSLLLENANEVKAYTPLSTVPGSPSNFDRRSSNFERIMSTCGDDSDVEMGQSRDFYEMGHL